MVLLLSGSGKIFYRQDNVIAFLKALSWYVFAPILFHIKPEFL